MAAQIAGNLATPGRVPDHDGILEVKTLEQRGEIIRIRIHIIAVPRLGGAPVTAPVMRNHAIAELAKVKHLTVPIIRAEGPAVREHNGLSLAPVLVINLRAILHCNRSHGDSPLAIFDFRTVTEKDFPIS